MGAGELCVASLSIPHGDRCDTSAGRVAHCAQSRADRDDVNQLLMRRTGFVFARWMVVLIAAMTGLPGTFGPKIGGIVVLLVYAGATVYFEIFPNRALAWLNPKAVREERGASDARESRRPPGA
jgi:hypothetical protein